MTQEMMIMGRHTRGGYFAYLYWDPFPLPEM